MLQQGRIGFKPRRQKGRADAEACEADRRFGEPASRGQLRMLRPNDASLSQDARVEAQIAAPPLFARRAAAEAKDFPTEIPRVWGQADLCAHRRLAGVEEIIFPRPPFAHGISVEGELQAL